jgi:hypothetical protein
MKKVGVHLLVLSCAISSSSCHGKQVDGGFYVTFITFEVDHYRQGMLDDVDLVTVPVDHFGRQEAKDHVIFPGVNVNLLAKSKGGRLTGLFATIENRFVYHNYIYFIRYIDRNNTYAYMHVQEQLQEFQIRQGAVIGFRLSTVQVPAGAQELIRREAAFSNLRVEDLDQVTLRNLVNVRTLDAGPAEAGHVKLKAWVEGKDRDLEKYRVSLGGGAQRTAPPTVYILPSRKPVLLEREGQAVTHFFAMDHEGMLLNYEEAGEHSDKGYQVSAFDISTRIQPLRLHSDCLTKDELDQLRHWGVLEFRHAKQGWPFRVEGDKLNVVIPQRTRPEELMVRVVDQKLRMARALAAKAHPDPGSPWMLSFTRPPLQIRLPDSLVNMDKRQELKLIVSISRLEEQERELNELGLPDVDALVSAFDAGVREARETTLTLRHFRPVRAAPVVTANSWTFDLSTAGEARVTIILKGPDKEVRPQIDAANWTVRAGASPDSKPLAKLDARGEIGSGELGSIVDRNLLDKFDQANDKKVFLAYLHPSPTEAAFDPTRILIEPNAIDSKPISRLSATPPIAKISLRPSDIRGFAPALALELHDGSRVELIGEADELGPPNFIREFRDGRPIPAQQWDDGRAYEVVIGQVQAITPIGLSGFKRVTFPEGDYSALRRKNWRTLFPKGNGVDFYGEPAESLFAVRRRSGRKVSLRDSSVSRHYRSLAAPGNDELEYWDGKSWQILGSATSLPIRVGGRSVAQPKTALILISACDMRGLSEAPNVQSNAREPHRPSELFDDLLEQDSPKKTVREPAAVRGLRDEDTESRTASRIEVFSKRWRLCSDALFEALRKGGFRECRIAVVHGAGRSHKVMHLQRVQLDDPRALKIIRDDTRQSLEAQAVNFAIDPTLDRSTERLVRALGDTLDAAVEPGSPVLVVIPEGVTQLHPERLSEPWLMARRLNGFTEGSLERVQTMLAEAFATHLPGKGASR